MKPANQVIRPQRYFSKSPGDEVYCVSPLTSLAQTNADNEAFADVMLWKAIEDLKMPPKGTKRPRKRSSDAVTGPPPITFVSPGLQLDARLLVFDQEYHVHSLVLKLHSAYFRRYLHSAEKDGEAAYAAAQFKYDYVSVIDEDGVWGLEPADKVSLNKT